MSRSRQPMKAEEAPALQLIRADTTKIRRHLVDAVLVGTEQFYSRYKDLTLKEVFAAYKMELATYRRSAILNRLKRRAKTLAADEVGGFFDQVKKDNDHG